MLACARICRGARISTGSQAQERDERVAEAVGVVAAEEPARCGDAGENRGTIPNNRGSVADGGFVHRGFATPLGAARVSSRGKRPGRGGRGRRPPAHPELAGPGRD